MMKRTADEWAQVFAGATAGYLASGDPGRNFLAGEAMVRHMEVCGLHFGSRRVIDVGCGNGRLASALTQRHLALYLGVDVIDKCIDFCRRAFRPWGQFWFAYVPTRNQHYAPTNTGDPAEAVIPTEGGIFDIALATSLFSHLGSEQAAQRHIEEIGRVLAPGGLLWATWYRSPPAAPSTAESKTIYHRAFIQLLLDDWEVVRENPEATADDQWEVLLRKHE